MFRPELHAAYLWHSSGEVQCGGSALYSAKSRGGRRGGRRRRGCIWVNLFFLFLLIILIFIVNHLKLLEVILEGADWVVQVTLLQNEGVLWPKGGGTESFVMVADEWWMIATLIKACAVLTAVHYVEGKHKGKSCYFLSTVLLPFHLIALPRTGLSQRWTEQGVHRWTACNTMFSDYTEGICKTHFADMFI